MPGLENREPSRPLFDHPSWRRSRACRAHWRPLLKMVLCGVRMCGVWRGCTGLRVLCLPRWRKVGLFLALWQDFGPNFEGLSKVSGVATYHWVFLRCDL